MSVPEAQLPATPEDSRVSMLPREVEAQETVDNGAVAPEAPVPGQSADEYQSEVYMQTDDGPASLGSNLPATEAPAALSPQPGVSGGDQQALLAGKYASTEALQSGYLELESRHGREVGELTRQLQEQRERVQQLQDANQDGGQTVDAPASTQETTQPPVPQVLLDILGGDEEMARALNTHFEGRLQQAVAPLQGQVEVHGAWKADEHKSAAHDRLDQMFSADDAVIAKAEFDQHFDNLAPELRSDPFYQRASMGMAMVTMQEQGKAVSVAPTAPEQPGYQSQTSGQPGGQTPAVQAPTTRIDPDVLETMRGFSDLSAKRFEEITGSKK